MGEVRAIRPPLGLPNGSVRALLTLLIVSVVIVQVVRGNVVEPLWVETLMIALAHYFTSRRFINLPRAALERLESEGHLEAESNPLYLPRHTIRIVVLLAFFGLAVWLLREGRLLGSQELSILGVVLSYLLGIVLQALIRWWTGGKPTRTLLWWEDLKAIVVLLVLLVTAGAYLADRGDLVPDRLRNATLGLVLFYFGSR